MIKTYTTKANALRALKNLDLAAVKHAKELIVETDGTWSFDRNSVEAFLVKQEEFDNAEADVFAVFAQPKNTPPARNAKAHEQNLDAAYRALEERAAMGEDMSGASVDENTYEIVKVSAAPVVEDFANVTEAEHVEHHAEIQPAKTAKTLSEAHVEVLKASLALDRRVICLETGEVFKSAYKMFTTNPTWMNMSQRNKMTGRMIKAAKAGEKITVEVNGRNFELVSVK